MAQLTWRELSTPDFSGSLRGIQASGDFLGRAFSGLQSGLDEFDASKSSKVNNLIALKLAAAQDPEAAKALSASLATDPNAGRITAQTAALAAARPTQLINQAAQETNLFDMKRQSGQAIANDALASDLARGVLLRSAEGAGTLTAEQRTELNGINQRIAEAAGTIGTKNALGNLDALNDAETGGLDRAGTRLGFEETRLGMDQTRLGMSQTRQNMSFQKDQHNWQVEDRNDQKSGQAAYLAMQGQSYSPESALAAFSSGEFKNLSPGAKMFALQQLNGQWGNIYSPAQLGEMSGFSGSSLSDGTGGVPGMAAAESSGNWGALNSEGYGGRLQFGAARLADAAKAGLVPAGTTGAQFSRMPPAKQKAVEDWHWKDIDNQTKDLAQYHGRTVGGVPINQTSIRAMAQLGGVTGARKFIQTGGAYNPADSNGTRLSDYGRRFSSSGASITGQVAGSGLRAAQDREGRSSAASLIQAAAEGPSNPLDVVAQLKKTDRFKGTNTAFIKGKLDDIVTRSNGQITYSMAGRILQDAARVNNDSWAITNWLGGNSARINNAGDRIDTNYIDNEIKRAAGGGLVQDVVSEADTTRGIQTVAQAQAQLAQAQAEYRQVMARRAIQPGVADQLPRIKARMDAAQAALTRAAGNLQEPRRPAGQSTGAPEGGGFWDTVTGLFRVHR